MIWLTEGQRKMLVELQDQYKFSFDDLDSILDAVDDAVLDNFEDENCNFLTSKGRLYQDLYDDIDKYNSDENYKPKF